MKILLTGGSGFIGRNIYEALKNEYIIFAPTRIELDICNFNGVETYIRNNNITIVIHTAVEGGENTLESMLKMFMSITKNIDTLEKVLYFGSGAEYAKIRDLKKISEEEIGSYIPQDPYGIGKFVLHNLAKHSHKIVNLRLFGIYGKYEDYRYTFISNTIVKKLFGLPLRIKQNALFDYLYVTDLISVIRYFIDCTKQQSDYNITPTPSISLLEIAQIIDRLGTKKTEIILENKEYNHQYTGSNARLVNALPTITFTPYISGIEELFRYYTQILPSIDKEIILHDDYFNRIKIK
ncbi:NAD-dependent epimerase/dehydratase family protein [soil metagenome]